MPRRPRCRAAPSCSTSGRPPSMPWRMFPPRSRSRPDRRSGPGSAGSSPTRSGRSCCCSGPNRTGTTRSGRRCGSASNLIVGYIHGGFAAWAEAGRRPSPAGALDVSALAGLLSRAGPDAPLVIDVRQASEYELAHVPGSVLIGAGDLPDRLDSLPRDRPIATICASGYRASVAASLLRAAGFARRFVGGRRGSHLAGGPLSGRVRRAATEREAG